MNEREYVIYSHTQQMAPFDITKLVVKYEGQNKAFIKNGNTMYFATDELQRFTAAGNERFDSIERLLNNRDIQIIKGDLPPKFFGGFAFDSQKNEKIWKDFPEAMLILFKLQFTKIDNIYYLTQTDIFSRDVSPTRASAKFALIANQIAFSLKTNTYSVHPHLSHKVTIDAYTNKDKWIAMVNQGLKSIKEGKAEKIVLSRIVALHAERIYAEAVLSLLIEQQSDVYTVYFEPYVGKTFISASPELLVSLQRGKLKTMGLAGSINRGATAEEDDYNKKVLLTREKELEEHRIVVASITNALAEIAEIEYAPNPQVLTLSYIHHLYTPIQGKTNASIFTLLGRLHPTAALGGYPKAAALQELQQIEPYSRGWYGAPIGWVDSEGSGVFIVGIRSARINIDQAWAYAGAGITRDSSPLMEWEETQTKFMLVNIISQASE